MNRTLITIIAAAILAPVPHTATAQWTEDPSENLLVSSGIWPRIEPAIAVDGRGGAVIVWREFRPATGYDILAQRLDTMGVPAWDSGGVEVSATAGEAAEVRVAPDGRGGVYIVWRENRGATGWDLYVQNVDSTGASIWAASGDTVCAEAGIQDQPELVPDGAGGIIVVWRDLRNGTDWNLYAQRFDSTGTALWTAGGVPVCVTGEDQTAPRAAADGAGGAVVAWADRRSSTTFDIYAQRLGANGAPAWAVDGIPISIANHDQANPKVAGGPSATTVIAWEDARSGTSWDIYAQRINGSGITLWNPAGEAVCTAPFRQASIDLAGDGSGGAILTWQDERSGFETDIYAQKLQPNGGIAWTPNGFLVCGAANYQYYPHAIADGSGGGIFAWHDLRNGSTYDVYAQRVTAAGAAAWTTGGIGISTAAGDQTDPVMVPSGDGNAILAWKDGRGGGATAIYAQNVLADGSFGTLPWVLATAGPHGSISPPGITAFPTGGALDYVMTPEEGYHVDSVFVNGSYVGSNSTYTFFSLSENSTIHVVFAINVYTITATAGPYGSISQPGVTQVVHGQTQAYSITPDPGFEIKLVHVDGEEIDTTSYHVFNNITANHTIQAWFGNDSSSLVYMGARWNLVSLPYETDEDSAVVLFPGAATNAYYFDGSYQQGDVLETGRGYWIKYDSAQIVTLYGTPLTVDTVNVAEGWNLIGSIAANVPVNEVQSVPAGIVTSQFFRYSAGYVSAASLQPSRGYWVKVSQAGQLVLAAGASASPAARIRIVPTEDLPPAPPSGGPAGSGGGVLGAGDGQPGDGPADGGADGSRPRSWRLDRNHPNPFNPSTTIGYRIPVGTEVLLEVYNAAGERIATLAEGYRPAGEHRVVWDAAGRASGVYFYRLTAGPFLRTGKMVLLK